MFLPRTPHCRTVLYLGSDISIICRFFDLWIICFNISFDEKKKEAYCIQGFTKRYFSYIGIIWFPNFNTSNESNGDDLIKLIKDKLNFKIFYIRLRSHIQKNNFEIINPPFGKVKNPIDSSKTMILNLENSKEEMYENLSKNWRRNLNRSKKLDYEIVDVLDAKIISQLYKNFENLKGILSQLFFNDFMRHRERCRFIVFAPLG